MALNQYGAQEMAEAFLNSGNSALVGAGREWADANHYVIVTSRGWVGPGGEAVNDGQRAGLEALV